MVAARRGVVSVEDLRGRKVAVTPSTLGPYVLSLALEEAGMGLKDVLVVDPLFALRHRNDLVRLLRTWQDAHDYADRHPDEADRLMAFREKLSVSRFREAEKGLLYLSLREQGPLLEPGGVLADNLAAVQRVQVHLGMVKPGAPIPRVDDEPLRLALGRP